MQREAQPGEAGHDGAADGAADLPPRRLGNGLLLVIFTATTFLSATLLFSVQPMFARMVLPILGGSSSVWAVAMLFFQAALLAGYAYAHLLISVARPWLGGLVHLVVCLGAVFVLPISVPAFMGEPPAGDPSLWQLALFAVGVGLPFFAVAANAPLLQAWFAASGHPHGPDPYFLYGASNLGSLLALLAYPVVLEPAFGVSALAWIWAGGFLALIAMLALSLLTVRSAAGHGRATSMPRRDHPVDTGGSQPLATAPGAGALDQAAPPSLTRRLGWVGLAFVPSALLTAFTNHITMDVASAPLLWVIPLALYLLTFVLVFRDRPIALWPTVLLVGLGVAAFWSFAGHRLLDADVTPMSTAVAGGGAAVACIALVRYLGVSSMEALRVVHVGTLVLALLALAQTEHEGWFVTASTGVAVFFAATMVAHRTLYEMRPAAGRLTEFYLLMSLGGVLGGVFAALVAPRIFSQVYEYPLLLALTIACRPGALSIRFRRSEIDNLLTLWVVAAACVLAIIWVPWLLSLLPSIDAAGVPAAAWWLEGALDLYSRVRLATIAWGSTLVLALLLAVAMLLLWRQPTRQLVVALAMCATIILLPSSIRRSDAQRSYFGVYRVYPVGEYNILSHGTTLHGAQRMRDATGAPAPDTTPGTYYYPEGPMARAITLVREKIPAGGTPRRFGVIGLGAGSLACLAKEGERWRFYEIDPLMVEIALDPANFTYLESCHSKPPNIVVGDARLTLAREPDASFDLIIVDAFTSDAVPIHLMTAEALRLYVDKAGPDGVVVLHISNRYLDLDSVLAATARLVPGAHGLIVTDNDADGSYAQSTSTIAAFSRNPASLAPFREEKGFRELDAKGMRAWTDDYSDIIAPFLSRFRD